MTAPDSRAPPLAIHLFGPFEVRLSGEPLPRLRSRKAQWLLALLALRAGSEIDRGWLAGTLWPDSSPSQGLALLRREPTGLRRALGEEADCLRSPSLHTLSLDLISAEADVVAFDLAIGRGDLPALKRAAILYRGPLLEEYEAVSIPGIPGRSLRNYDQPSPGPDSPKASSRRGSRR